RLFTNEHGRGRVLFGVRPSLADCAGTLDGRSAEGSSKPGAIGSTQPSKLTRPGPKTPSKKPFSELQATRVSEAQSARARISLCRSNPPRWIPASFQKVLRLNSDIR